MRSAAEENSLGSIAAARTIGVDSRNMNFNSEKIRNSRTVNPRSDIRSNDARSDCRNLDPRSVKLFLDRSNTLILSDYEETLSAPSPPRGRLLAAAV